MDNLDDLIGRKIQYKKASSIRDKYAYIVDRDPLNNNFMALFEDERTIWVNPGDFKLKEQKFKVEIKEYAAKDQAFLPCFVFNKKEKKIVINRPNYSDETASVEFATNNAIESLISTPIPAGSNYCDFRVSGYTTGHIRNDFGEPNYLEEKVKLEQILRFEQYNEMIKKPENDAVNHPSHYLSGKYEVIDIIKDQLSKEEFIGYLRGNIFKYQMRYKNKNGVEDLKKSKFYLDILIIEESNG